MKEFLITSNDAEQRLDKFLKKLFPNATRSLIYKLNRKGKIKVLIEGKKTKQDNEYKIQEWEKIQVFLSDTDIKELTEEKLKAFMQTKEGGYFSFLSGSGSYKQDAFDRDTQLLSYVYFNEGFVKVKVERPLVYVTPDKKGIYITFRVEEGDRYNIGSIDFSGDLLFEDEELRKDLSIKSGELFSYEKLQRDIRSLTAMYGDLGYAYANPIPRTRINETDRIVDVTFDIDKGNKVYIGKINMKGNTKTFKLPPIDFSDKTRCSFSSSSIGFEN